MVSLSNLGKGLISRTITVGISKAEEMYAQNYNIGRLGRLVGSLSIPNINSRLKGAVYRELGGNIYIYIYIWGNLRCTGRKVTQKRIQHGGVTNFRVGEGGVAIGPWALGWWEVDVVLCCVWVCLFFFSFCPLTPISLGGSPSQK